MSDHHKDARDVLRLALHQNSGNPAHDGLELERCLEADVEYGLADDCLAALSDRNLAVRPADEARELKVTLQERARAEAAEQKVQAALALVDDEAYHVGGAWGDYGEPVLLARNVAEALGEDYDRPRDERTAEYAANYAEAVEAAEAAERERDTLRELVRHLSGCVKRGGPSNYERFLPAHLVEAHDAALSAPPTTEAHEGADA